MKTAIQELLENLQKQFNEQTHPIRIDATYFLEKEKEQIQKELFKALKSGKIKDRFGKKIQCKTLAVTALQEEQILLTAALTKLPYHYKYFGGLYNVWNYSPVTFFTFLHYSRFISGLPEWIKSPLNSLASWYMTSKYPEIKHETKKIIKKKNPKFIGFF